MRRRDVGKRQINVVYFNVRQLRNNVVILNVEFYNVVKRRNNVVEMAVSNY